MKMHHYYKANKCFLLVTFGLSDWARRADRVVRCHVVVSALDLGSRDVGRVELRRPPTRGKLALLPLPPSSKS